MMYKIKTDYSDQMNMEGFESQISEYARIGQNVQIGKNCIVEGINRLLKVIQEKLKTFKISQKILMRIYVVNYLLLEIST